MMVWWRVCVGIYLLIGIVYSAISMGYGIRRNFRIGLPEIIIHLVAPILWPAALWFAVIHSHECQEALEEYEAEAQSRKWQEYIDKIERDSK